jgi:hypothetical protein
VNNKRNKGNENEGISGQDLRMHDLKGIGKESHEQSIEALTQKFA